MGPPAPHEPSVETVEPQALLAAIDVPTVESTPPAPGIRVPESLDATDRARPPPAPMPRPTSAVDYDAAERLAAEEAFSVTDEPEAPAVPVESVVPAEPSARLDEREVAAAIQAAVAALPGRASRVATCPFLRSAAVTGLAPPLDVVDPRHRCAALPEPLAVSRPQQELLCLQPNHVSCPRYARGLMVIQDRIAPTSAPRRSVPVVASALFLVVIAAAALTLAILRGGLSLPAGAIVSPSPTPTARATASPTPSATPSPTASPRATPTRRPTPTPTRLPAAWATLDPCPSGDPQSPCFLYEVAAGDSLSSIAERYDTTVERIEELNPEIQDPDAISEGDVIRLPPPER